MSDRTRVGFAASDEEVEGLRAAVREGRLFGVQRWIAEGKPLYRESKRRKQALELAVESGFHSMVQVLAEVWPDSDSLNRAAEQAARKRRSDLVWLLPEHGAAMSAISLESVAECCDKDLMRHFLDHWDEVGGEDNFTEIVLAMPHPLTGLIKEYAARIPNYRVQLGAALNQFVEDGHLRWIALTMWMGADPRMPAAVPSWGAPDPECLVAPVEYAVWKGNIDGLKLMKVSAGQDDLNALLRDAFRRIEVDTQTIEFLIGLGASINNKPNGGSSAIDSLLSPLWTPYYSTKRADVWALERWVERGARFIPDDAYAYRNAREGLCNLEPHDLHRATKVLSRASEAETLIKLLNTPKLRGILGFTTTQLSDHVHTMYRRAEEKRRIETEPPRWANQTVFKQVKPRIVVARHTSLSRVELYESLWNHAASQAGKELGVSDVWLAKVCKAYRIPKPGRGYWAKVDSGRRVVKRRLPDPEWNPELDIATYCGVPPLTNEAIREEVHALIERLSAPGLTIDILTTAETVHPLFRESPDLNRPYEGLFAKLLGRTFNVNRPLWEMDKGTVVDLSKRAAGTLNAFVWFAEPYGFLFGIETTQYRTKYMTASIFGESVSFHIEREGRKLRLRCFGLPFTSRSTWSDGKRHFVESYFADFACALAYSAAIQKCERASKGER